VRHENEESMQPTKLKSKLVRGPVLAAASLTLFLAIGFGIYFLTANKHIEKSPLPAPTLSVKPSQEKPELVTKLNQEKLDWNELTDDKNSNATLEAFIAFLQKHPNSQFTDAAQARIAQLDKLRPQPKLTKTQKQEKPGAKYNIKLMIKPWGTVFVDGVQLGASPPLKTVSLSEGKHKIRVTNPGFPDFINELSIDKNNTPPITHEFGAK
jgi:hypothetical protein